MFPIDQSNEIALGIKDKNIKLREIDPFEQKKFNGRTVIVYHAKLTYHVDCCPNCGYSDCVIKNGTKSSQILLPGSLRPTYLDLKKQRFYCKKCHSTFMAQTDLVAEHCSILKNVHWAIELEARRNCTIKDISQRYNVSSTSVQRIISTENKELVHETQTYLPKHLLFDEFKATNTYSFIWLDAQSHGIGAILPSRKIQFLTDYFNTFPRKEREKVRSVVVDLNAAYIDFIPKVFPNAKVIVDRFHIVNMANRSLNTVRKQLMKRYKHSSREYKLLKGYWRLFLKDFDDLEAAKTQYQYHLGYYDTQVNLVHLTTDLDTAFKKTYWTYQAILHAIHTRNAKLLKSVLNDYKPLRNEMDTTIASLKKHWSALLNSCRYEYSNGPIEGMNGKIKKIKKISYGYHNFDNFKLRIYLQCVHI